MPSKKQYDLVQNDDYDTRIPLHPEEAFHHGITFQAKYIGMLDVPRPTSRVEIVAAMRRIRYEFKSKGIKKKKVTIEVSVDGIKVTLRKKKKRRHWMDDKNVLLQNPIYRVFYVSHDSQDLKIFSYIARDGASNLFKCAVFKSNKKSQAMRIVRTVGQAFEVCHKLSINGPEHDSLADADEQDTLTQDLLSDRFSDIVSDKPKKDLISECASDKISLPPDDCSFKDNYLETNNKNNRTLHQLDILPPPPPDNNSKKSPLSSAETYASPHSDHLNNGGGGSVGSGSGSLPPAGSALSAHHELQLMREQLEQQNQQTQAAMAQLQLAREQLAAEQSARLEAQARTHQLLVHNRELLDHIAALVAHLQGGDKTGQQQTPPHMTMPQQPQHSMQGEQFDLPNSSGGNLDNAALYQALGLTSQGLIENRSVASCLPSSPLRNTFNPSGGVFNFQVPPIDTSSSIEAQLLQRLQSLSGFSPPTAFVPNYAQALPYLTQSLINQALLNNNYTLPSPPIGNKMQPSSYSTLPRNFGTTGFDTRPSSTRRSEPRHMPLNHYQSNPSISLYQNQSNSSPNTDQQDLYTVTSNINQSNENPYDLSNSLSVTQQRGTSPRPQNTLQAQPDRLQRSASPRPSSILDRESRGASPRPPKSDQAQFIKPLAQIGTLTTTDSDGRVRVIVPVPSNTDDDSTGRLMSNLKISDDFRMMNGPGVITRSTSERVPNRSELMQQVQRTAWARHTTK